MHCGQDNWNWSVDWYSCSNINSVPVHYNVTPKATHQFISLSLKSNSELYTIPINLPNSMRNWFMIGHNRNTTYSTCPHAPILTLIKHLFVKDDLDAGAVSLGGMASIQAIKPQHKGYIGDNVNSAVVSFAKRLWDPSCAQLGNVCTTHQQTASAHWSCWSQNGEGRMPD